MRPVSDPQVPAFVTQYQRVDSYAEILEVMRSADFAQGGAPERMYFLEGTLLLSEGEEHTRQKQVFARLMSREALAYYELHLLEPVIQDVIGELKTARGPDGLVHADVCVLVPTMLTRIAARVTGVDGVDTPERTERFRSLVQTLSEATTGSFTAKPIDALMQAGREALQALVDDYLRASLDRRLEQVRRFRAGDLAETELSRDMLTALCLHDAVTRPDDEGKIPFVWRQCALFLTAAIKTTSHSLPHIFVHLDEWVGEHPQDRSKLTDAHFLHQAIGESLRLHQTAPVRFRTAIRDTTLSTGRAVRKDEMVALYVPPANVEAETFGEDSRYFNPYRQPPDGLHPWGMTFGAGVHLCLGRNLVTGLQNVGDDKYGTHGTIVRIVRTLYELGAELDPDNPPLRPDASYHDTYESMPIILRGL